MKRLLEKKLLFAALAASMMLTACPGGPSGTDAGTDAGEQPDGGGTDGGSCQYPNTTWAQLLNAPVAAGVTVIHKTATNPPYDGGMP